MEAEIKGAREDFSGTEMDMGKNPLFYEVEAKMKKRFQQADLDHPITEKLYNLCLKRKLKKLFLRGDAHD